MFQITVALVAGVVLGLAERVGEAHLQAVPVAAIGADLQAVVPRAARVLGHADDAVALVGTQRRDVHARVGLKRARRQLVDVPLALQIDAAAADVGDVHGEAERNLALDADAPHVGRRVLEDRVLAVDAERQVAEPDGAAAGLSTLPLETVTCGWNGGLPPSSVESFSVTRLWKMPPLARTIVFSLS